MVGSQMDFVPSNIPSSCVQKAIEIMVLNLIHIDKHNPSYAHTPHCFSSECTYAAKANNTDPQLPEQIFGQQLPTPQSISESALPDHT